MRRRRRLAATLGAALLIALWLAHPDGSAAAIYIDPAIAQALVRRGVPASEVARVYPHVLAGIGESVRAVASYARHITPRNVAEVGLVFADHPPIRAQVITLIEQFPGRNAAELAEYLHRGPLANVVRNTVPATFRERVLDIAYTLSQEGGQAAQGAIRQTVTSEAGAGAGSALREGLRRIGARLGAVFEWLSGQTAQRILGIYTIGQFTQAQINEALYAFQDEMEAVGDAAEAEAYNNNVDLMMRSLRERRTRLVPGMNLAAALRQLRRNMNIAGQRYFDGILIGATGEPPPDDRRPSGSVVVWLHADDVTCCPGDTNGQPNYAFHATAAGRVKPGAIVLQSFESQEAMKRWACGRPVASHYWAKTYARIGAYHVTQLPCPVNTR